MREKNRRKSVRIEGGRGMGAVGVVRAVRGVGVVTGWE